MKTTRFVRTTGVGGNGLKFGRHAIFHVNDMPRRVLRVRAVGANSARTERRVLRCQAGNSDPPGPTGAFDLDTMSTTRRDLFDNIAPVYDQLNDILSLGLHRVWKRAAIKWSGATLGDQVLDVCCGSGDVALRLSSVVGPRGKTTGLDFAVEQLNVAADREAKLPSPWTRSKIEWVEGDALRLPFDDNSFDAVTLSFGLRNVADIPKAMCELHRVLRPGCTAAVLDFNNSTNPVTKSMQSFMLDNLVVPVAKLNNVEEEYAYLKPSIARFPTAEEQERVAVNAGFAIARHYDLSPGGLMGCLVATKAL